MNLTIEMGNAGMQTPQDVARALRKVADQIEDYAPTSVFGGPVKDANGNTVGHYHGAGVEDES